jgi:hypothetical protein
LVDILGGAIPMNVRHVLKYAVICAIAQICALATPAWSAQARKHAARTHNAKTQAPRPPLRKSVARKHVPSRSAVGKRRTSRGPSTPRAGQRAVADAVGPTVTAPVVSSALTLGWWAQCGSLKSPFSFTSLRLTSPRETAPLVAVEATVDLPAQPAPASEPVVAAESDDTVEPVGPFDSIAQPEPAAPSEPAAPPVELAAGPVEPNADAIEPAAYVLEPVAQATVGTMPRVTSVELVSPANSVPDPVSAAPDKVRFIGLVEARTGTLRVAVLRIAGRIVYGRQGDVIAGRYRLLSFTEDAALIFDLSASVTRTLAMGSP